MKSNNEYPYYSDKKFAYEIREYLLFMIEGRDTWKFGKKDYMKKTCRISTMTRMNADEYDVSLHYQNPKDYVDECLSTLAINLYSEVKSRLVYGYLCIGKVFSNMYEEDGDIILTCQAELFYSKDEDRCKHWDNLKTITRTEIVYED